MRIISAFVALSLYCFSLAHASALWFSDAQGLHRIDTASGTVAQHLPQQGVDALTLNQKDGSLWALLPGQLVKYDANGNTMVSLDLKTLATNFNAASRLALTLATIACGSLAATTSFISMPTARH